METSEERGDVYAWKQSVLDQKTSAGVFVDCVVK